MADITYMNADPEELWEVIAGAYYEAGGDIPYPGDEKEMLLRVLQAVCMSQAGRVEYAIRRNRLKYAEGDDLDVIGVDAHCERVLSAKASGRVQIKMRATGATTTIASGARLTADGLVYYETADALAVNGYAQTVYADIVCTQAGEIGNGLMPGTQMQFSEQIDAVESVVVYEQTAGGSEREDDETYRERIRVYGQSNVTTGPSERYEAVAKSVSSKIRDAKAVQLSAGMVGVVLLAEDGETIDEALVKAVSAALRDRTMRPLTDRVLVRQAQALSYTLNVNYTAPDDATGDLSVKIAQAVETYREWQGEKIGRAFDPDYLVALLYQAGATRISLAEGSTFNGGGAVYTKIETTQYCTGTVNLIQAE